VRCAACGARNSASADWCTQCYVRLGPDATDRPTSREDRVPSAAAAAPIEAREPTPTGGPPAAARARDVRDRAGTVEWRCRRCDTWSPLLAPACVTCGSARQGFGETDPERHGREVDPALATGLSVVFPGAGHLVVGRPGTGIARLVLWLLWLLGGVATVRGAGSLVLALPGLVLLVGAVVLWGATLADVRSLVAGDDREVLGARGLLWLVGGVVVALVVGVLAAALLAR
jgi:hypothetical protein